jgi:hypothetical protein
MKGILYDWKTAELAGRSGHLVRRKDWTTKWLRWYAGLWWLREDGETERVVRAEDFGRDEFLATDWTHMPPDCLTEAGVQAGTTCPAPFLPADPGATPPAAGSATSSTSQGASAGTSYDLKGFAGGTAGASLPPPPGLEYSGVSGSKPKKAELVWPELSFGAITDETGLACYPLPSGGLKEATFEGTLEMTDPSSVQPGPYEVHILRGTEVIWSGTMGPGDSEPFSITVEAEPGSTVALSARAWAENAPDITATATTPALVGWCDESGEPIGSP